jgi:hypothetical protein
MDNSKTINLRVSILAALILITAFSRLIPHMPNFSPFGAIALFGAAHFTKRWQAFFIPIAAVWLSDLFIINVIYRQHYTNFTWFYDGFYWQYATYALITFIGLVIFRKLNIQSVLVGALTATAIFFLVTNFGCFPGNPTYAQNFSGLMACYAAGVPFLKGTLLGNLVYTGVLFGFFAILQQRFSFLRPVHNKYAV